MGLSFHGLRSYIALESEIGTKCYSVIGIMLCNVLCYCIMLEHSGEMLLLLHVLIIRLSI